MTDQSVSIGDPMATRRPAPAKTKPLAATAAPASPQARSGPSARKARTTERRAVILAAALEEFSTRGFEATRLDDVAKRAKIAKGTIYLYFRDKESLFQELIRDMLAPII